MIRGTTESSSCQKLILGAENDPDTAKHRGRRREGRVLGGELWRGGQEEYKWDWREGKVLGGCDAADAECRSAREWKWVYVGAAGGGTQGGWRWTAERSGDMLRGGWRQKHKKHQMQPKAQRPCEIDRERERFWRKDSAERRQSALLSQSQSQNTRN